MNKIMVAAAILAGLAVSGCAGMAHTFDTGASDRSITEAYFRHAGSVPREIVLVYQGKRYEARDFPVEKTQSLAELRRKYGFGKHWDRILVGNDTNHLTYSAHPELRAADGDTLECSFAWMASVGPSGQCRTADGRSVELRFQ
jgi:hypothetical protein